MRFGFFIDDVKYI